MRVWSPSVSFMRLSLDYVCFLVLNCVSPRVPSSRVLNKTCLPIFKKEKQFDLSSEVFLCPSPPPREDRRGGATALTTNFRSSLELGFLSALTPLWAILPCLKGGELVSSRRRAVRSLVLLCAQAWDWVCKACCGLFRLSLRLGLFVFVVCFCEDSVMTLLEPEMLMMAVQSGNSLVSCKAHLPQASLRWLNTFVLALGWGGRL